MTYPGLLRRCVATALDLFAVGLAIFLIIRGPLLDSSAQAKFFVVSAVATIYEPVLTAYACTIGQALTGIRVRHFETLKRITLRKAYLRFVTKYVVSMMAAAINHPREDRRANHDLVADTVVVTAGGNGRVSTPG